MKKKKTKLKITHEDILRALEKFKKAGGLIKKLPDQHAPSRVMAEGKGIYENVEEFLARVDLTGYPGKDYSLPSHPRRPFEPPVRRHHTPAIHKVPGPVSPI